MTRICSDCPKEITRQSKSGRCQRCATRVSRQNPEREARRLASQRETMAKPGYRAALSRRMRTLHADRSGDPAWVEAKRLAGQRLRAAYDASPAAQAANAAKRGIVGRKLRMQRLPWLPEARIKEYENLRDKRGAAEAKRIMLERLTPFERQMARVAAGARLIDKPDLRPAAPSYSLVGNATGML